MTQQVLLKRSAVPGKIPTTGDLALGEVAINTYDGRFFFVKNDGTAALVELLSTAHATLDDLTDVTITTPAYRDVLFHNGIEWENRILAMEHLSNMSMGEGANEGDTLFWSVGGQTWQPGTPGTNVVDDITTDATFYPLLSPVSFGSPQTTFNVSSTELSFNPSTGILSASIFSGSGASLTSLNANSLSSGTVSTARLGSGTANSSTYLRGDGTWATIISGATIANDTTTNATYYPTFATASSGTLTTIDVSSTKLTFNPSTGVLTATGFSGSGAALTSLTAGNLSGTIPSAVLGNSTHYVGTTAVALNRASANQALTGILSVALPGSTSGTITLTPAAVAGTTAITIPATAGTLITTGDTGTVTNTMLAGSIANAKLVSSSVTIGSTAISLGASATTIAGLTSVTSTGFTGALTGNASTATAIAGGLVNQIPYQTGAGATSFYSAANYGIQAYGATGVPQAIAGAAGVLVGSASAVPSWSTTPSLTGTNFTGIPNGALTNSSLTIGSTAISLGASATTIAGLTSVTSTGFTGALTGNASTATALQTARTINGVSFDGTTNITVADSTKLPLAGGSMTGSITIPAGQVITLTDQPTVANSAANKAYVDARVAGLTWKQSVKVATSAATGNITLSGGAPTVVDGVTLLANQRVLVKNQTTAAQNGIYEVTTLGTGTNGTWTRAADMDALSPIDEINSAAVFVEQGTAADTGWTVSGTVATLGTDAVTWTQFTGASAITQGTGISISGNTLSLATLADSGTGSFLKITRDTYGRVSGTTAVTSADITGTITANTYQPYDADLTTWAGVTPAAGIGTFLATPSSANLATAITDETGSGSLVFATSPTLVTPNIGVATGTSFNSITGLSSTTPAALGTAAVGTGTSVARADHVHALPFIGTTTTSATSGNAALSGISSITLPGSTSGTAQIIPSAVAGTGTIITLPATSGTLITTGDTGTVTNTMLAGSIANAKLVSSSVTIGSTAISLGASATTIAGLTSVTSTGFTGALTGNASTATAIAGGLANQIPYQTGAGATSFYSAANYGIQAYGATGVPQAIAGAAGVLVGSASAVPSWSTTPSLTGTNFTGIPNGALTNSSVTVGTTSISLGASSTTLAGLTSVTSTGFTGALTGNASTATALQTARTINGTSFDGSANITITANTTNALTLGTGLTGTSFNGSSAVTANVDSTAAGTPSIYSSITTGSLTIGGGLTTGSINVATGTDSAKIVNIGTTSSTSTITGIVKLPTVGTSGLVKLGTGGQLSAGVAGTDYMAPSSAFNLGTTSIALNRASGAQSLTGISIDGSAGSAATVAITNIDTAGTYYIPFTASTSGNVALSVDATTTPLSYNPNTGVLTAAGFSGPITGSASQIAVTSTDANGTYYPTIVTGTGTAMTIYADNTTTPFFYNPNLGTMTVPGTLTVSGDFIVNGTTTTVNSATLNVNDINVILGNVTTPTDVTANGGGITLKGATDKTFNWVSSTSAWTSSENLNLLTGKVYEINGTTVLSGSALGTGITSSSLTSVGTITSGTWNGGVISSTYGGTGVNNGGRTLTINTNSGTITFTNASTTLTVANTASVSGTNTGDQTITLTGDVTGSGTGSFATTLANSGATAGTYNTVTVNAKGLVTSGSNTAYLTSYTDTLATVTGRGASTGTAISITNATASTSTSTGALIVTGGVGIGGTATAASVVSNSYNVTHGGISSATVTTTSTTATTVDSSVAATYRTIKYIIQVTSGTSYQSSEIFAIHDGTTVTFTETNVLNIGSSLGTFDMSIATGNVNLVFTAASATSTTVKVIKTIINV